jgi:hypothetical protein
MSTKGGGIIGRGAVGFSLCERQKWRLEMRDGKMELAFRAVESCNIAGVDLSLLIVIPIYILM